MRNFEETVPFNPGYESMAFSFIERIQNIKDCYALIKSNAQKKAWLPQVEPQVNKLLELNAAFYLGCILWGGFLAYRFTDSPKEISDNAIQDLSEEDLMDFDCAEEPKAALKFIQSFEHSCICFLKRPMRISPIIKEIYESYVEFAQLNEDFLHVKTTADVKVPKAIEHFKDFSNEQLDELCDKIYAIIEPEDTLLGILDLGFYRIN